MNPILEQFLIEARENLLYLDKNLNNLKNSDPDIINALFRAAHTLKGGSGLAGLNSVKEITHIAEDILDAYRNNKITFTNELSQTLYDMFDEVTELIDATEETGEIIEVDSSKISEFKEARAVILEEKEEKISNQIDTELVILDEGMISFAHLFENKFENIDFKKISFESKKVTKDFFEEMNYYIIDMDLPRDSIKSGNDPFYALFLLENENIITFHTSVNSSYETIKENPLDWVTRIVLIVNSNQELLEDAFYNFMDSITIYPLSLKSLFWSDLKPQSNEIIIDFVEDIQGMILKNDFKNLLPNLQSILEILNPNSLQTFIFKRLHHLLEINEFDENTIIKLLNYALEIIKYSDFNSETTVKPIVKNIDTILNFNIEEKEAKVIVDILKQQKIILENKNNKNRIIQVKSILEKLEINLQQNFNLSDKDNDELLMEIIENLIISLVKQFEIVYVNLENSCASNQNDKIILEENNDLKNKIDVDVVNDSKDKKIHTQIAKTVKIDLQDIDIMMDIVGEMLVIKNSLPYIADSLNSENVESTKRDLLTRYDEINRVTILLQEKVMDMRLLSLSFIFDRYPKLVRDISKSLNKEIKYLENGGDTKLDKTIIEKLADPLIHIIRNSLDHGIEEPGIRLSKNKKEEGLIHIKAKSVGDKVYVSIEDDGKGIDVDKVIEKSLEKGIITKESLIDMTEEEKLLLVFHPGISTMDKISELSGRGVGMDVVRQTINEIGGKISLKSEIDKGTIITLELPVSVALTNVFHVKLGNVNYALSMDSISETVKIPTTEVEYLNHNPMLKLRGHLIPLMFNYNLLSDDVDKKDSYSILIVETQGIKFGFVVDKFVNQLDIVQKPLASNFRNHPFISGTSLLGNGEVLFVINPSKLIKLKEKK